ncbi:MULTISPECIES: acyltransferase [unclassified Pseudomonas]|uniref:acyltransferase family protein n=1 Tax=unclassified Pseudomonas TaxID=196821 RepID=UPI002B22DA4D|nr:MULTISPECIES: acyltransferase [unclassified Pseudomonas]MEA9994522.1 acyltransferase [Pseudomonas sp. AA4]MEB0085666.1 acyltransferase [Pseudomonas sp. RTI1]MEB0126008.1 acyltransferase [Pseudomonas sp. CCC1.2]MEB0152813.1 acyltransferase [Pseudomonas sp. CCC4.3]MEB0221318.1 acyltransferase [Pseudomonas sp. AB12(2023)]
MHKIAFANALRGIACISVVIYHYVAVFNMLKGEYGGIPALPYSPYPAALTAILNPVPFINLGAFGVSLFFLISGFVIPLSVDKLCSQCGGRVTFVVSRLFRIWPTYIAGFFISLSALTIAAKYMGYTTPYTKPQIAANLTLFRDWFGGFPQIDGVIWTLEIEIKFYLAILLFWGQISKGKMLPFIITFIAMLAASTYRPLATWPSHFPESYLFCIKYIFFMMIGMTFNYHHRGLLKGAWLCALNISMLSAFLFVTIYEGWSSDFSAGYATSFIVFSAMYVKAKDWQGNAAVRHLATISYPLYACHAMFGAVAIRIMIDYGIPSAAALAIQLVAVIVVSTVIHKLVERPSQIFGKKISKKINLLTNREAKIAE